MPVASSVALDDGTASWATSTEPAGAEAEFTAHESILRGMALAQAADLSHVTDAQLEEYRAALAVELSRADAEKAARKEAAAKAREEAAKAKAAEEAAAAAAAEAEAAAAASADEGAAEE